MVSAAGNDSGAEPVDFASVFLEARRVVLRGEDVAFLEGGMHRQATKARPALAR
ncbi:MAG: hypothetical protein ACFBZ8_06975 [Opitutales bacterium]